MSSCFYQAKSQFKRRSTANNVEIIIPVPMDADTPKFKTTTGSCKYAPDLNAVIWTIKSFPVSEHLVVNAVIHMIKTVMRVNTK